MGRRFAVLMASVVLAVTACGAPAPAASAPAGAGGFPRTITHAMGSTAVPSAPRRVVTMDASLAGAVLLLGTELVGYTALQTPDEPLPAYLGEDAKRFGATAVPVGMLSNPNLEAIAALKPDLILATKARHANLYEQLGRIAPTIMADSAGPGWKDSIRLTATALGKEDLATAEIGKLEATARHVGDAIRAKLGRNPVVSVVRFVDGPTRLYTADTYSGVVLADAGLARPESQKAGLTTTSGQIEIGEERISDIDADDIFVTAYPGSDATRAKFQVNPLWGRLKGAIHEVPDQTWMSAVGLRGAEAILGDLQRVYGVNA